MKNVPVFIQVWAWWAKMSVYHLFLTVTDFQMIILSSWLVTLLLLLLLPFCPFIPLLLRLKTTFPPHLPLNLISRRFVFPTFLLHLFLSPPSSVPTRLFGYHISLGDSLMSGSCHLIDSSVVNRNDARVAVWLVCSCLFQMVLNFTPHWSRESLFLLQPIFSCFFFRPAFSTETLFWTCRLFLGSKSCPLTLHRAVKPPFLSVSRRRRIESSNLLLTVYHFKVKCYSVHTFGIETNLKVI